MSKLRSILVALALVAVLAGAGAVVYWWKTTPFMGNLVETVTKTIDQQVVESIEMEDDVVLLSLGIQDILEENESTKVFGKELPGSTRTQFIQSFIEPNWGWTAQP